MPFTPLLVARGVGLGSGGVCRHLVFTAGFRKLVVQLPNLWALFFGITAHKQVPGAAISKGIQSSNEFRWDLSAASVRSLSKPHPGRSRVLGTRTAPGEHRFVTCTRTLRTQICWPQNVLLTGQPAPQDRQQPQVSAPMDAHVTDLLPLITLDINAVESS